jgi:hypothetical protein
MKEFGMKRIAILAGSCLLVLSVALRPARAEEHVFHGEISDSQCALNVHSLTRSHQEMLKSKSMGGNATDCTLYCVKYHGGDFVLAHQDVVYRLDNQSLAQAFAGQKVKVMGSLQPDKKTIHVVKIESEQ